MGIRITSSAIVLAVFAGGVFARTPIPGQVPGVSPACSETCPDATTNPQGASVCAARIALCQTKLGLYATYMAQLAVGVQWHKLPQVYVGVLRRFFPSADLTTWEFAAATRQPPNVDATTDCDRTYFRTGFVDRLRATGGLTGDADFRLLFHELQHVNQCRQVGGRDRYARMWFQHLEVSFIRNTDIWTLHDRMPMEDAANSIEPRVLEETRSSRDRDGRLVAPIKVAIKENGTLLTGTLSRFIGTTLHLSADVKDGSPYNSWNWEMKRPNDATFSIVGRSGSSTLDFAPTFAGTYDIAVRAFEPGGTLAPARTAIKVAVNLRPDQIPSTPNTRTRRLSVHVTNSRTGAAVPAAVCGGTADSLAKFGRQVAGSDGRALLTIPVGSAAQITASSPGYIGVVRNVAGSTTDAQLEVKLTPGVGGPACR